MDRHAIASPARADSAGARRGAGSARYTLVALLFLATLASAAAVLAARDTYRAKAGFLLNFARLTEWPAAAQPAAGEPIVLGVMADASTAQVIGARLAKARVGDHPVTLRSVASAEDVVGCHIVFVASDGDDAAILEAASGSAALSVGESEGFAERGGVINFFSEGEKLRFEINPQAADRAGLKISSRLLRLARLVSEP
jgi:hypothetical protein